MQKGFTLIELLVVISIMALAVGVGIGSYLRFQEKQTLTRDVDTVKEMIEQARVGVLAGDLNSDACAYLDAYQVIGSAGDSLINLQIVCRDETQTQQTILVRSEILASDTSLQNDLDLEFKALGRGVNGYGDIVLVSDSGLAYTFSVSAGGAVSSGEFISL